MAPAATIGAALASAGPRANNFDAIRLGAAVLVLVSHGWPITLGSDEHEPLYWLTGGQSTLGGLAVIVFFFVSGMLVSQSWERDPHAMRFFAKRALRLLPALIVAVLISTFVLGTAMTRLPRGDYLAHPGTWAYLWNMVLRTVDTLPGVFHGLPFPDAVNGSLWTLPYEARCYIIVMLLGVTGWFGPRLALALTMLAWLAAMVLAGAERLGDWNSPPLIQQQTELFLAFALGMVVWLWRSGMPLGWMPIAAGVLLFAIATQTPFHVPLAAVAIALVVPTLAYAPARWPRALTSQGDYSYGIYLYAFPVQQSIVALAPVSMPWWLNILIAIPITIALAALSWHFVERPALALKRSQATTGMHSPARA